MVFSNTLGPPDIERETTIATTILNPDSMEFETMNADLI